MPLDPMEDHAVVIQVMVEIIVLKQIDPHVVNMAFGFQQPFMKKAVFAFVIPNILAVIALNYGHLVIMVLGL